MFRNLGVEGTEVAIKIIQMRNYGVWAGNIRGDEKKSDLVTNHRSNKICWWIGCSVLCKSQGCCQGFFPQIGRMG